MSGYKYYPAIEGLSRVLCGPNVGFRTDICFLIIYVTVQCVCLYVHSIICVICLVYSVH